jgi:hypothetical protein
MRFGIKYYWHPMPVKVQKRLAKLTAAIYAFAGYAVVSNNIYVLASSFALNEIFTFIAHCFFEENNA